LIPEGSNLVFKYKTINNLEKTVTFNTGVQINNAPGHPIWMEVNPETGWNE
jgi:hypothetical protein